MASESSGSFRTFSEEKVRALARTCPFPNLCCGLGAGLLAKSFAFTQEVGAIQRQATFQAQASGRRAGHLNESQLLPFGLSGKHCFATLAAWPAVVLSASLSRENLGMLPMHYPCDQDKLTCHDEDGTSSPAHGLLQLTLHSLRKWCLTSVM